MAKMVCGFEDVLAFFMQASRQAVRSGNNAGLRSIRQQNELLYKAVRSIYLLLRSFLIVPILLSDLVSLPSGFRTVPAGRPRSFSIFPTFLSRLTFPGAFPPRHITTRTHAPCYNPHYIQMLRLMSIFFLFAAPARQAAR